MIAGLLHILGIDDVSGRWYALWSGFGGDLGLIGAAYALLRKHNCHQQWCPRIGRHPHGDWMLCSRHHPLGAPTATDVTDRTDRQAELLAQVVIELREVKSTIQRGGLGVPTRIGGAS
ncbi:MAG TPA: hypothetical protein VHX38_18855 [Pseudonocardiaceae bacterium]|nr:hypothetical protein [Pseudonocardiaceae bacterium]